MGSFVIRGTTDDNRTFDHFCQDLGFYFEKLNGFDLGNFRKIIRIHPHNMIFNMFVADFNPMIFDFIQSDLFTWKIPYDFIKFSSIYGNYSLGFNVGRIRTFKSRLKISYRNGKTAICRLYE